MPFGAALVIDGEVVAASRNRQVQEGKYFSHAEVNCLEGVLNRPFGDDEDIVMVATEAPCPMCAGAIIISGIREVVVGEDVHYKGALTWLKESGITVNVLNHPGCIDLVKDFKANHPQRWSAFSAG